MHSDTVVVGAGPIGIEVAAALRECGTDCRLIEAGQIGATIMRYPRNTVFFSSPEWIAICGIPIQNAHQRRITGEEYLAYLRQVVETLGLPLQTYRRVVALERITPAERETYPRGARFVLHTRRSDGACDDNLDNLDNPDTLGSDSTRITCRSVVLAIGDMHRPNLLNIPGEELPTVTHYFDDPHRYFQTRLLIVGGRNSALEAALRAWRAGVRVGLCYRRATLSQHGLLARNRLEISLLIRAGQIEFLPNTTPTAIRRGSVDLVQGAPPGRHSTYPADFVFLATGFHPDTRLYRQIGIELVGSEQVPRHDAATMESNIGGIYIAGTATAGRQQRYRVFISTCRHHAANIARAITGRTPRAIGNLPTRAYALDPDDIE